MEYSPRSQGAKHQPEQWQEFGFNSQTARLQSQNRSSLNMASEAELTSVLTWIENKAVPIVENRVGIPQYTVPSSIRSEVNERLRELMGHTDSEKLDMIHDVALLVRCALREAKLATESPAA